MCIGPIMVKEIVKEKILVYITTNFYLVLHLPCIGMLYQRKYILLLKNKFFDKILRLIVMLSTGPSPPFPPLAFKEHII